MLWPAPLDALPIFTRAALRRASIMSTPLLGMVPRRRVARGGRASHPVCVARLLHATRRRRSGSSLLRQRCCVSRMLLPLPTSASAESAAAAPLPRSMNLGREAASARPTARETEGGRRAAARGFEGGAYTKRRSGAGRARRTPGPARGAATHRRNDGTVA